MVSTDCVRMDFCGVSDSQFTVPVSIADAFWKPTHRNVNVCVYYIGAAHAIVIDSLKQSSGARKGEMRETA